MLLRLCVALLLALGAGGLPLGRAGISPSPPTRTPVDRSPPGEGSFSGYRQLDSSESGRVAVEWRRRMGVISGNTNIELYELICLLEEFSLALPGAKPHRRELMALAEFEDGLVKTVALAYCVKVKCPWELTVSGILSSPLSDEPAGRMVDFIREVGPAPATFYPAQLLSSLTSLAVVQGQRHLARLRPTGALVCLPGQALRQGERAAEAPLDGPGAAGVHREGRRRGARAAQPGVPGRAEPPLLRGEQGPKHHPR